MMMSCCEKGVWVWLVGGDAQRDGEVRAEREWMMVGLGIAHWSDALTFCLGLKH